MTWYRALRRALLGLVLLLTVSLSAPDAFAQTTTAVVEIPGTLLMSDEGAGFDTFDVTIRSSGGPIAFTSVGEPVTLPIPVAAGRGILEYTDSVSGTTVTPAGADHLVRIPIRDAEGNDTIRILLTVAGLVGTGTALQGTIEAVDIDLPTRSVNLESIDPTVGTASVKVLGSLSDFPGASGMTMTIEKEPDTGTVTAFRQAAASRGLDLDEIGFSTGFAKTNLDPSISSITLRLSLSRAWVDARGLENVRVFRRADDGSVEELPAPVEDPLADRIQFNVSSPNGLSTFVIAAVSNAPTPTPTPSPRSSATPTPSPTATPTARATAAPTLAPGVTPDATSVPTPTPLPTDTPSQRPSPTPTAQPPSGGGGGTLVIAVVGGLAAVAVAAGAFFFLRSRGN